MKFSKVIFSAAALLSLLLAGCATNEGSMMVAGTGAKSIVTGSNIPRADAATVDIQSISKAELQYLQSSGTSW